MERFYRTDETSAIDLAESLKAIGYTAPIRIVTPDTTPVYEILALEPNEPFGNHLLDRRPQP